MKNVISQAFIFMQSLYLNVKILERERFLYKDHEKSIETLPKGVVKGARLAILHNAGAAATRRMLRKWDPRAHYLPQFVAVYIAAVKAGGGTV